MSNGASRHGWAYIHPDFRGPNNRPEATGSKLVVADIVSAVEYAKKSTQIDHSAIYLVGTSGGGYTALVMAGHHPEIWAGVSAWVPISDLAAWHAQGKHVEALEQSCGGAPGDSPAVDSEYAKRSPITFLSNAKGTTLHLHAGIKEKIVPISHSLLAFNELAAAKDRIPKEDITYFVKKRKVPQICKPPPQIQAMARTNLSLPESQVMQQSPFLMGGITWCPPQPRPGSSKFTKKRKTNE